MPLKRDEKGGGTNADGSKNATYCSHCFVNGKFVQPNITVVEMQTLVKSKLKEFGIPSFLSWIFTRGIPNLERWRTG
jgi:hypothetical protein